MRATERLYELWNLPPSGVERVQYASNKRHDPELLKWWNWKDNKMEQKQ